LTISGVFAEGGKMPEDKHIGFFKLGKGSRTVILVPGIGDLKENYLELAEALSKEATVYGLDLRGTGESTVGYDSYGADQTSEDILEFIHREKLDRITIVANSMSCASAVLVSTKVPEKIDSVILTGPFLRDKELGFVMRTMLRVLFSGPWGPSAFQSFYESLYPVIKPSDLAQHSQRIKENLKEDGRLFAVRSMFLARKPKSEDAIQKLTSKVIIVMGDKDPDFDDPVSEAKELANLTKGEFFIFQNSGHYPYKDNVNEMVILIKKIWEKE